MTKLRLLPPFAAAFILLCDCLTFFLVIGNKWGKCLRQKRQPLQVFPNNFINIIIIILFLQVEESDIIDLEKRYWLLKAQSRTGRFDLETFVPLVSPPIHASLSEGNTLCVWQPHCINQVQGVIVRCLQH